jgi:hypothetical protein
VSKQQQQQQQEEEEEEGGGEDDDDDEEEEGWGGLEGVLGDWSFLTALPFVYDATKQRRQQQLLTMQAAARATNAVFNLRLKSGNINSNTTAVEVATDGTSTAAAAAAADERKPALGVGDHSATKGGPSRALPVRVGVYSDFFRRHSSCRAFCGLLPRLNKSLVELTLLLREDPLGDPFIDPLGDTSRGRRAEGGGRRMWSGGSQATSRESVRKWADRRLLRADNVTLALIASVGRALLLPARLEAAATAIRAEKYDVLLYGEVGLGSWSYQLAAALPKLAPVQSIFWGHPFSSGLDTIDYFVTSSLFLPPPLPPLPSMPLSSTTRGTTAEPAETNGAKVRSHLDQMRGAQLLQLAHSERLVPFRSISTYYHEDFHEDLLHIPLSRPPHSNSTMTSSLSLPAEGKTEEVLTLADIGIPERFQFRGQQTSEGSRPHVYFIPQSLFKIHPLFDSVIRRILRLDPLAVLLLLTDRGDHPSGSVDSLMSRWRTSLADEDDEESREGSDATAAADDADTTRAGELADQGLPPATTYFGGRERVLFLPKLPKPKFKALLRLVDVVLDTFPGEPPCSHVHMFISLYIFTCSYDYMLICFTCFTCLRIYGYYVYVLYIYISSAALHTPFHITYHIVTDYAYLCVGSGWRHHFFRCSKCWDPNCDPPRHAAGPMLHCRALP